MSNLILGLDLATTSTGFAVLEGKKLLLSGLVQPPSATKDPLERISVILNKISEVYEEYDIGYVAIEDIPLNYSMRNLAVAKHNLLLAGGAIAIGNQHGSAVILLAPSEWRKAAGVYDEKVTKGEMSREFQKEKGIEIANGLFDLNLEWVSDYADKKTHDSDIAEAALIGYAAYRIFKKGGNSLDGQNNGIQ